MNSLIDADKDPMGRAIMDYFSKGRASRLRVFSSLFYEDEIPVVTLFRSFDEMPPLEQEAMRVCRGRVLDVGAGSGCHSLELMSRGLDVVAIDISQLSVDVMKQRGIDCDPAEFYATMNMLWSDYGAVAKKFGVDSVEYWSELSKSFLKDKDAEDDKLALYYECIVKK